MNASLPQPRTELPDHCQPDHSTHWRWNLALRLVEQSPACPPSHPDPLVHDLANLLSFERYCPSGLPSLLERETVARVWSALKLRWTQPLQGLFIEARLLTGQSPQEIAEKSQLIAQTVEDYTSIFFDVLDRLDDHDWLQQHVLAFDLSLGHFRNLREFLFDQASRCGGEALEQWISQFERLDGPTLAEGCPDSTKRKGREEQRWRLHLASCTTSPLIVEDCGETMPLAALIRGLMGRRKMPREQHDDAVRKVLSRIQLENLMPGWHGKRGVAADSQEID